MDFKLQTINTSMIINFSTSFKIRYCIIYYMLIELKYDSAIICPIILKLVRFLVVFSISILSKLLPNQFINHISFYYKNSNECK